MELRREVVELVRIEKVPDLVEFFGRYEMVKVECSLLLMVEWNGEYV
ncbi:hypothetical protein [Pyrococcus sp. ST04]|nr:hypothetical protein [Pyrococcus sp. ST04]